MEGTNLADKQQSVAAHSDNEFVVEIEHLNKVFKRRTQRLRGYTTCKQSLLSGIRRILNSERQIDSKNSTEQSAASETVGIHDLTLRIPKGASVGLIGRNGSGKSTFLKLITGIYKPSSGRVQVKGRIAALIELGAGFHPDFTGRENLFLSGIMHGLSRDQIAARFDDIVGFAELEDVIDDPVRTYSSGMFMRLGFSIAIHTDPEVLLVDEVLAVGDAGFVAKCKDRISELRRAGKTLILVTHDLDAVERWCDEAIWLDRGEVRERGTPRMVIDAYRSFIERVEEADLLKQSEGSSMQLATSTRTDRSIDGSRWGSREVEITKVTLRSSDGEERRVLHPDEGVRVCISYKINSPSSDLVFGVAITRIDGLSVFGSNTEIDRIQIPAVESDGVVECSIPRLGLVEGGYSFDVAVHRSDGYPYDYLKEIVHFSVRSDRREVGVASVQRSWSFRRTD